MNCPKCGGYMKVTDSRFNSKGVTRRRRICYDCGYKFSSYEMSKQNFSAWMEDFKYVKKALKHFNRAMQLLDNVKGFDDIEKGIDE